MTSCRRVWQLQKRCVAAWRWVIEVAPCAPLCATLSPVPYQCKDSSTSLVYQESSRFAHVWGCGGLQKSHSHFLPSSIATTQRSLPSSSNRILTVIHEAQTMPEHLESM